MTTHRPPMRSHEIAAALNGRRDNRVQVALPHLLGYPEVSGVTYDTFRDTLVLAVDPRAVCDTGICTENPVTPGRCPHGRTVGDRTVDPTADLDYMRPAAPVFTAEVGDYPELLTDVWAANGMMLISAFNHLMGRPEPAYPIATACCNTCCLQCRALHWHDEHAPTVLSLSIAAAVAVGAPQPNWPPELRLTDKWDNAAAILGCHQASPAA